MKKRDLFFVIGFNNHKSNLETFISDIYKILHLLFLEIMLLIIPLHFNNENKMFNNLLFSIYYVISDGILNR